MDKHKSTKNSKNYDSNRNRTISLDCSPSIDKSVKNKSNASPVIIPKNIRTVSCFSYDCTSASSPAAFDLDGESDPHWSKPSPKYKKKIRVPKNPEDNHYLNKAIDFLTTIETRSGDEIPSIEIRSYSDSCSSSSKKSYKNCLSVFDDDSPIIDLSDVPATIQNSLLKDNLNQEFKEKHPFLDHKVTLSKIVNLREEIIWKMCWNMNLEAFTIALAWNCFVRLLSKNLVTKDNRKLYGAICVLLSYKFNEESHLDCNKSQIKTLVKAVLGMDKHNLLQHKDIHKYEFEVYANLNFSLLIDFEETEQDFLYTLQRMDISPVEYIGDFINDSDFFNKLSY